jgi:multiple sugar transport system ATP-binding protein
MSVAENIAYPLRKRGVPRADRERQVGRIARMLQLDGLLARKPGQLSGGQQQRVALGRALVREPQVFLLDEPLSNLDAALRAHMRAELIELHNRIGKTMVYVTHDQLEAMTMSTRIAVMRSGLLQQLGTAAEIYGRPANIFVAGFIGTPSMTLLDAEVRRGDNDAQLAFGGLSLTLPAVPAATTALTIGIRPEDVIVGQGPHTAITRIIEPTGHEAIVRFDIGNGVILKARVGNDVRLHSGEAVPLDFRMHNLHLFDRATGVRLANRAMA